MATPTLVTLVQVKRHLRLPEAFDSPLSPEDEDLHAKLDQATELVLEYIARRASETAWADTIAAWTESTVPRVVQAAILRQTAEFYRFRGDDPANETPVVNMGYLAPGVATLLHRLRDPVLA